ncbi:MAG: DNA gyrase subunit A [Propionibacteriaceae bacterium]|nr:DNA gyrase subunit A [Propionibacteriaceae bacterium]
MAVVPDAGIEPVELQHEVRASFLDYAMSVIVDRALPDVRDGLKPVHRRVIYAMYDGGYRPDRGWNKCSRVIGEVMGLYHPHGDSAIYDTLVRLAQPWVMRAPLVAGQGNFGSPGNDPAAAMRYTECKMAPLAMEMVREIDQDTVDFQPNYDNRETEPTVLPARFPNLLVNGSTGIAVGMATNIPTHNLREVNDAVQWALAHPEVDQEELLQACLERIKGPDFPRGALIVGRQGIENAYRTGRGSVIMRAVVSIETDDRTGRTDLVVTELPYMCNPDTLAENIAGLVNSGKITGIADIRDDSSARTGQRLVISLKRDAQPRVVLNNLYKHTKLQDTFGCNMIALVDGVPRTLRIDQFISYWVAHQIQVIVRRTSYQLAEAEKQAHIYRGLVAALDQLDAVIALIRASRTADVAREGLKNLLGIDDVQANAILDMQLRRLAAQDRQKIIDRLTEIETLVADLKTILASEDRQRAIVSGELQGIVDKYGDERRTQIVHDEGDFSAEDFIPNDDMVVTITMGGYAKRTTLDHYRSQRRGGKGVKGARLRQEDEIAQLFTVQNHNWVLFFTNQGRVYRLKAWQLPEANRDAKGGHVAGLLSFQPGETIAQVLTLKTYDDAQYLLLATKAGLVKKTKLKAYDSARQSGLLAVNFRNDDDELVGADLVNADDDVLLISRRGQAIRFRADDVQLRPMGRVASGVKGMDFRGDDALLSLAVIPVGIAEDDSYVFTVTDGGYAKRSAVSAYRTQGRGGLGIKAMKLNDDRGQLVGGLVVKATDEVIAIRESGQVTRSQVVEVPVKGRDTMGVKFVAVTDSDAVKAITVNPENVAQNEDSVAQNEDSEKDVLAVTTATDIVDETNNSHE